MTLEHVAIIFQVIAFLFAISVHESAHAWMANRCGDPTARMLGRITLNPIKHIDIFGTVLLPLLAIWQGFPMIGWAKPTPVNPGNFKRPVRDDILTSIVGPISNFLVACMAAIVLILIKFWVAFASRAAVGGSLIDPNSPLVPLWALSHAFMEINVLLAVFNLIPIPPLDGSHVLRHLLPENLLRIYDAAGWFALIALVFFAPGVLNRLFEPVLGIFEFVVNTV